MRSLYVKYPPESYSLFPIRILTYCNFILFPLFSRPSSWNNVRLYTHRSLSTRPYQTPITRSFLLLSPRKSPETRPLYPRLHNPPLNLELADSLFLQLPTTTLNHVHWITRTESGSSLGLECKKGVMLQSSLEDAGIPVFFLKLLATL